MFLTSKFSLEKDLVLDSSFDINGVKNKLINYFVEGYFELKIEDFEDLNSIPEVNTEVKEL